MSEFVHLQTISELYKLFKFDSVIQHPLVAVIDFGKVKEHVSEDIKISADFYSIMLKTYSQDTIKYGRKIMDFQDGSLICMAPNQVIEMDIDNETPGNIMGWGLYFHPDLIRATSLNSKMKQFNFFSYDISESLHLSEKEKEILYDCVSKIENELEGNIDIHSQNIIVSTIELLLNYCTRFYGRQFITRKISTDFVANQIDKILSDYFNINNINERSLPTVKYLAEQIHLSPSYLSDLLKKETGKNAQEHIHLHVIKEAKNVLLSTNKTVGEIAHSLGFEYPQYFNKLFRQKTGKTPIEFRNLN